MKNGIPLVGIILFIGCSSYEALQGNGADLNAKELAWEEWSSQMLSGGFGTKLPQVPAEGWVQRGKGSWVRNGAQISDINLDGRIDYLRIADPPNSYNHNGWMDLDFDGYFDSRGGEDDGNRIEVPKFEPANQPLQTDLRFASLHCGC